MLRSALCTSAVVVCGLLPYRSRPLLAPSPPVKVPFQFFSISDFVLTKRTLRLSTLNSQPSTLPGVAPLINTLLQQGDRCHQSDPTVSTVSFPAVPPHPKPISPHPRGGTANAYFGAVGRAVLCAYLSEKSSKSTQDPTSNTLV